MKGRYFSGIGFLLLAGVWISLFSAGCRPSAGDESPRIVSDIQSSLPTDCRATIRTYIDSQLMRTDPGQAVNAFRRMATRYPYAKDSAAHAFMKCFEGQAWDVLHAGDSMLACYDDAGLYLEAHPELIDMRAMSYLFSGWAHYYKNNRLTANYYFNKAGNELEDTSYIDGGRAFITSNYPVPTRIALLTEIAGNAQAAGLEEQAKHYIQRALYAASLSGNSRPDLQAFALIDAGMIYTHAHQVDSGNMFFARARAILPQLRDTMALTSYYDHKGSAFLFTRQYDSSLAAYQSLIRLQEASAADTLDKALAAEGLAASYIGLGQADNARKAIAAARPVLYDDTTTNLTERAAFSRTYLRCLVYGTAAAPVFERFVAQNDSVFDQHRLHAISDMDAQYSLQKKEARISHLNKENKSYSERVAAQQTLLLVFILIIALLAAVVAFLRQYQRRRRLEAERNKAVLEQQLLRSQMEPHFIFNTLSVLQSLIRRDERERSVKYLSQFAKLLRISLEHAREALVPLSDELEALQHYLSLQQVRFQNVFTYLIDTYEGYEEEAGELLIPPMLLQPFVENAIQHGVAGMKDNTGRIRISIQKEEKALHCTIEDNGPGNVQARQNDPAKKKRALHDHNA